MTTDSDLSWLAGFFDGEGSISISNTYRVELSVSQNVREPLDLYQATFGGSVHKTKRNIFCWIATGEAALRALTALTPLLKVKRPQAELALEYQRRRQGSGRPVVSREQDSLDRLELRALNAASRQQARS